jgi:hypothetical protein
MDISEMLETPVGRALLNDRPLSTTTAGVEKVTTQPFLYVVGCG